MEAVPVINHLGLTVGSDLLQGAKRDLLREFYGGVLGWEEMTELTEEGKHLVFRLYQRAHFVNLLIGAQPSKLSAYDHLGILVPTKAAFDALLEKAKKYKETRDPSVEITSVRGGTERFGTPEWRSWGVYFRYLLPMRIEVQCYER